uniref:Uncharacterized protein n=1 Tax=Oryza nivara TaxID=4536 RepID=A0A0E0I4D3_ORYNI
MPATEATLTSRYGAYFARATMARNILAPVAGTLSGHPSELHRRCILVRRLPSCTVPGEVCDMFDMFASIEAIAVSGGLGMAVVVFGVAVADCMSAAVLRTGAGFFEPVPPLHLGPPLVLAAAMDIKVALHPKKPTAAVPGGKDVVSSSSLGDEIRWPPVSISSLSGWLMNGGSGLPRLNLGGRSCNKYDLGNLF